MPRQITDPTIAKVISERPFSPVELFDEDEPGLRVRISADVARWSYRTFGGEQSRLRISLGTWPDLSTAKAREMAQRLKIAFDVTTPKPASVADTLAQLLELYRRRRLSQLRKGSVIYGAISKALAPIAARAPAAIGRRDISAIVDCMADRAPIQANRVLAYSKAFFSWACGRGYIDTNPAAGISKPTREIPRERTPSLSEIVEIWLAAGELGYPFGSAIRLLLLTASRRDELGGLRAEEVSLPPDAVDGCWTLPATRSKNGRAIRCPLAPLAREILTEALTLAATPSSLVFTTTGVTPISGWSKAKARLDRIIGRRRRERGVKEVMSPWRLHDLRRAFATAACDLLDVDPAIADRCLNHVGAATSSTVARIYGRSELYEQRREALIRWADLIGASIEAHAEGGRDPTGRPSSAA